MVYLQNTATYIDLEIDYSWDKTYFKEANLREKKRGILKRIAKAVRIINYRLKQSDHDRYLKILGPGKILDIGCGDVVRWKSPFIPFGIEISKNLSKYSCKKKE